MPRDLKLKIILYLSSLGDYLSPLILCPGDTEIYKNHVPKQLPYIRAWQTGKRLVRAYWVQGEKFLEFNKTYEEQMVRRFDTIIVSDIGNNIIIEQLAQTDPQPSDFKKLKKKYIKSWSDIEREIRDGY